jgi:hypothetical protein
MTGVGRAARSAALVVLMSSASWAQFTLRGGIDGVVTDSSQAVVPGVEVTLTELDPVLEPPQC